MDGKGVSTTYKDSNKDKLTIGLSLRIKLKPNKTILVWKTIGTGDGTRATMPQLITMLPNNLFLLKE